MANIAPIRTDAEIATIINKAQHALADLGWEIVNEEKQGIDVQNTAHRDKVYQLLILDVALKNILDENGDIIQYYQASANEEKFNNILSGLLDLSKSFDGPAIPMLLARNGSLVFYPSTQSSVSPPSGGPAVPGGTTFQNLSVNSPSTTIDSFSANISQFVFYIVSIRGTNGGEGVRTSILSGSWFGSNDPVYTETKTEDVGGDTSAVTMKIELSSGNIQLNAYTSTDGWIIQGVRILFQNISFSSALGPLPPGGTTNQLLKKNSNSNYDVSWFTLTVAALTDLIATVTELNYSQGLTGNIQAQFDAIPTLASGVYTPDLFPLSNVFSSTAHQFQWMQVGTTVTVSGTILLNSSAIDDSTQLDITLPVASNFSDQYDLAGNASDSSSAQQIGSLFADGNFAKLQIWATTTGLTIYKLTFTYVVK